MFKALLETLAAILCIIIAALIGAGMALAI